jgi:hypothetical protein
MIKGENYKLGKKEIPEKAIIIRIDKNQKKLPSEKDKSMHYIIMLYIYSCNSI